MKLINFSASQRYSAVHVDHIVNRPPYVDHIVNRPPYVDHIVNRPPYVDPIVNRPPYLDCSTNTQVWVFSKVITVSSEENISKFFLRASDRTKIWVLSAIGPRAENADSDIFVKIVF